MTRHLSAVAGGSSLGRESTRAPWLPVTLARAIAAAARRSVAAATICCALFTTSGFAQVESVGSLEGLDDLLNEDEIVDSTSKTSSAGEPGAFSGDDLEIGTLEGLDDLLGLEAPIASPTASDGGGGGGVTVSSIRGSLESWTRSFVRKRRRGPNDEMWILRADLELALDLTRGFSALVKPRALVDVLDEENRRFEPFEAYISCGGTQWDLRVGQYVENWGIADTFNPIDVLNRRDLGVDFLDPERLGELGARARFLLDGGETFGEPTLSLHVLPVHRTPEFPREDSRWRFGGGPGGPRFAEDREVRPEDLESVFLAARFQSTFTSDPFNADLQLVLARGPERFPTFVFTPTPSGVDLVPVYFGATTVGGGLRAVPNIEWLADYTMKAEIAYRAPFRVADPLPLALPDDYVQWAVGVDRLFPSILLDRDQLTLTLEHVGEAGASDIASDFRPFDNDAVLRAFWELNDFSRTSVEARAIVDLETGESIFQVLFERQLRFLHEDLKIVLDAQVFVLDRAKPSLFNAFANNTNLALAFIFEF